MLSGYFASSLFILCLVTGIYLFGYAARNASILYVTLLEVVLGSILLLPFLFTADKLSLKELFFKPVWQNWLWLGLASVCGFVGGNFFSLVNLRNAGEVRNSLLSPAITAMVVLISVILFKEKLGFLKFTGIIITLGAVVWFLLSNKNAGREIKDFNKAIWSGLATIICITLFVWFSIRGDESGDLSIFHALWLRMILALPIVIIFITVFKPVKTNVGISKKIFYIAILAGVLIQTIIANYLWYYATFRIGASAFQTIVATLPLWVYTADISIFKKSSFSFPFLIAAFAAAGGIALLMW